MFGCKGYIDFVITLPDGNRWGVELLRDGDRLAEHASRFAPGGRYSTMPMQAYALVDMRTPSARTPSAANIPHLVTVTFDDNYSSATIFSSSMLEIVKLAD